MKKISFLPCLLLFNVFAYSQSLFSPGYIVKTNSDTIKGLLKQDVESKLIYGIYFKSDENASQQFFPVADLYGAYFSSGMSYSGIIFYDSLNQKPDTLLARVLVKGDLDLYTYKEKETRYFIIKDKMDSSYLLYNDVKAVQGELLQMGNYKGILSFLSRECSKVSQNLERMNFNEKEIATYVQTLNNCINPSASSKLHYIKPKKQQKIFLHSGGMVLGEGKNEFIVQAIVRFLALQDSRKFSLNTGLSYQRTQKPVSYTDIFGFEKTYNSTIQIASIPFFFQYNVFEGKFQPYFFTGFSLAYKSEQRLEQQNAGLQKKYGIAILVGAGMEIYISERFLIKPEWRYELLSHYPTFGLAYRLKKSAVDNRQ